MKRKIFCILFALVLVLSFSLMAAVPAGATTFEVSSTGYATIQAAINAASDGDTINVAAGTYTITSAINVNKGVTITGNTGSPSSVLVTYATPSTTLDCFDMQANSVTVQGISAVNGRYGFNFATSDPTGCTISDCVIDHCYEGAINIDGGSGHTISDNTITHCLTSGTKRGAIHIYGCPDVTIDGNTLIDNGLTGYHATMGIYVKFTYPSSSSERVEVTNNTISGMLGINADIQVYDAPYTYIYNNTISNSEDKGITIFGIDGSPAYTSTDNRVQVIGNTISSTYYPGLQACNAPYTYFYNNTLTRCNYYGGDGTGDFDYASIHIDVGSSDCLIDSNTVSDGINGIQVWSNDCTVTNNTIYNMGLTYADTKTTGDGTYYNSAILYGDMYDVNMPTSATISNNNIYDNYWGLFVISTYTGTVTAENNWWGDASGPTHTSNSGGTGDAVSDNVKYCAWLGASYATTPRTYHVNETCTIQSAIDEASDGDTVIVAAGTYEESVTVDKALTLLGAKVDVDPRAGAWTGDITTINGGEGNNGILVTVSDVTVNGFKVMGSGTAGSPIDYESGIRVFSGGSELTGIVIKNCWSDANYGSGILVEYAASPIVEYNYSSNNGIGDGANIAGIAGRELTGGSISNNECFNNTNYGIYLGGRSRTESSWTTSGTNVSNNELHSNGKYGIQIIGHGGLVENITVESNDIHDNGRNGMKLTNAWSCIIDGNQFTSNGYGTEATADKYKYGAMLSAYNYSSLTENTLLTGNTFSGNNLGGIYMYTPETSEGSLVGTVAHFNNFIDGSGKWGINNTSAYPVDATSNWWGSAVESEVQAMVSGNVDYSPWWGANYVGDDHSSAWTWYTNDSIQDAINAATSGDTINVADGTYTITEAITVDKGVTITGNTGSPSSVVVTYSEASQALDCFDMQANSVTVQGISAVNGRYGFNFATSDPTGCTISDCVIDHCYEGAINIDGGSGHTISDNTITHCLTSGTKRGAIHIYGCPDVTIDGNTLIDNGLTGYHATMGIYVKFTYPSSSSERVEVINNNISGMLGINADIQVYDAPYTYIYNNTISDSEDKGITIFGIDGNPAYTSTDNRVEVIGNTISSTYYPGLQACNAPYTYFYNNILTQCNYYGGDGTGDFDYASIHIDVGSSDCLIDSNTVSDGINGIQLWSNDCTVTNNTIYDMGLTYDDTKITTDGTYYNSAILYGDMYNENMPTSATISYNDIHDNYWGLFVTPDYAGTVTAENNWWGDASGPGGVGPGSGDAVSANVDFYPWWEAPDGTSTSPTVVSTVPSSGGTDVAIDADITATFSEAMNAGTISASTFTLANGGPVAGAVTYDAGTKTATFNPTGNLAYGTTYTATITTGAQDVVGNGLAEDYLWSFTTLLAVVTDLAAGNPTQNSIDLTWTTPEAGANAFSYFDARYSTATITPDNWGGAVRATGEPAPVAGGSQGMRVKGLDSETTYYFAIKLVDEGGLAGLPSNVASETTLAAAPVDTTSPGQITGLAASAGSPATTRIILSWTATGDDEDTGAATSYEIRRSASTITGDNWGLATIVYNKIVPRFAGGSESFVVSRLTPDTSYYFAIQAKDEAGNTSLTSNSPSVTTGADLPTVTGISPASGDNSQARTLTIDGTNFVEGTNVVRLVSSDNTFDLSNVTYVSPTGLTAGVATGTPTGTYRVRVINDNGTSELSSATYEVTQAPTPLPVVTNLIPQMAASGSAVSGVQIFGENLTGATEVSFDSTAASNVAVISGTKITADVPGLSAGEYDVRVTTPAGTNEISGVKFVVSAPVVVTAGTTGDTTTSEVVTLETNVIPVQLTLTTDTSETATQATDTDAEIEVVIPPGTTVTDSEGNPYTGNINPPRVVKPDESVLTRLPEDAVVIEMGNPEETINFGQDFVATVTITASTEPDIYYYNKDTKAYELAGKTGTKDGVGYVPGGTKLGQENSTYTMGLLLDHMSVYIASVESLIPPAAGGGGGGAPPVPPAPPAGTTDVRGMVSDVGAFLEPVATISEDGLLTLTIPAGTVGLTKDLEPLTEVNMVIMEDPPAPPEGANVIGLVYDLGPDGVIFDPPITLTFSYDPADILEGVAEEDLVLAYYDEEAGEWLECECTCDPETNCVTACVCHFTAFGAMFIPTPAAFSLSALEVSPTEVETGGTVTISALVENTGEKAGILRVTLKVNGTAEQVEHVALDAGASTRVSFTTSGDAAGSYAVDVNGLTGSFTVKEKPAPVPVPPTPAKPLNWPLLGGIIAGVVVVGLLIFFLVRRRAY